MEKLLTSVLILCSAVGFTQGLEKEFWQGDTAKFNFLERITELNDEEKTGSAIIYKASEASINASWEITSRLEFAPSASNSIDYVLSSSSTDAGNFTGYFLHLGETGSGDALELYRKDGAESVLLKRGIDARFGNQLDSFRIKVTRDQDFEWIIQTDIFDGNGFITEIEIEDSIYQQSSFFGLSLNYTSTRFNKFSFRNLSISGESKKDTLAPMIQSTKLTSDSSILVTFSEEVILDSELTSTVDDLSYKSVIQPKENQLLFTFDPFPEDADLVFNLDSIKDLAGNFSKPYTENFLYHETKLYDVLITELYPDPDIESTLPNAEYIEIYNNSGIGLELTAWLLKDLNSETVLPSFKLSKNEILVLAEEKDSLIFPDSLNVLFLENLPSLNNTSDHIFICDSNGKEIHNIYYQASNVERERSLEFTDIDSPCLTNYLLKTGGSPGTVYQGEIPQLDYSVDIAPFADSIIIAVPIDSFSIESISVTVNDTPIEENILRIDKGFVVPLVNPLEFNAFHSVQVENLRYCDGRSLDTLYEFILTDVPQENELVVSELLFNPETGVSEYIEIYNNTENKYFKAADVFIETVKDDTPEIKSRKQLISYLILAPQTYYVISTNKSSILNHYEVIDQQIIETEVPVLNNDRGIVRISTDDTTIIDCVNYDQNWHSNLFTSGERKGKSLERIDLNKEAKTSNNWFSSSFQNNYGSPTFQNSVKTESIISSKKIELNRQNVSPDGDGFEDLIFLNYNSLEEGTLLNATLFNSLGQEEKAMVYNAVVNQSGSIKLDFSEDGFNPSIGIHILLVELNYTDGKTEQFKLAVTVNKRF